MTEFALANGLGTRTDKLRLVAEFFHINIKYEIRYKYSHRLALHPKLVKRIVVIECFHEIWTLRSHFGGCFSNSVKITVKNVIANKS